MSLTIRRSWKLAILLTALGTSSVAFGATPTIEQALKLAPVQKDVDYDVPPAASIPKCTIKAEKIGGQTGWVVRGPNGQILREFVDTNGDNIVDRWSYYKDGVEVYRDIDENFNGKAEQHRWLNTGGTRWGLDKDEDGKINSWKVISPEEVSAEVVMALRDKDQARFERVLLTSAEAKTLGLGAAKSKQLNEKIAAAPANFGDLMRRQKIVTANTDWVHFGGTRPGLVPAGFDGSTGEVTAYENVVAMIETDGKDGQVSIGTMIKVGDVWRVIGAPSLPDPNTKMADLDGFFYQAPNHGNESGQSETAADGPSEKVQRMMEELSKLDEAVGRATSESEQMRLHDRRAELMLSLIEDGGDKDRQQWIHQFADSMSAAAQTGTYPAGVEKLKTLLEKISKSDDNGVLLPYVKFRYLTADYGAKLQKHDIEFVKVQSEWLDNLEQFVKDYPKAADAAEALLQLGIAQEFAGQEEKAKRWYNELVSDFEGTPSAVKARGALVRIDSVGRPLTLRGKMINGQMDDLAKYKGKFVLIHYWATWCEPCKTDFAELKELYGKYGKNLAIMGINLDTNLADATDYLSKNKLPWSQLWEPGGLDSRLANELGVLTLPTMILVDDKGKVVNRNVHITELEGDLKAVMK